MRNKLAWFRALPFWLAVRLILLYAARRVLRLPVHFSFAQAAEDIILPYMARLHAGITEPGTYVDVGCNSPVRLSNTFNLYLDGWRGINIDANKELVAECRRVRKQDVSITAAVSDGVRTAIFHKGKQDAVSTIDETRLVEWKKHFEFADEDRVEVVTRTLNSILEEHFLPDTRIDLLTIDVEGHDLQVLKGLDFETYRPRMIIIEMHHFDKIEDTPIYKFLTAKNYVLMYFAVLNAYFVDAEHIS
jgi:FkbM family methyltransferase